ncbi:hypothetical protein D9611_010940 [Ephemerocybe angulata]|uniref:Uncharacterized protein n=1 Tax=Ephemerocybe angulata TaxID=980116 RepID=A0A8H5C6N1_9AGAR|nr:hypothetical protein D9611_010940 [Tulosesus angulatus]
MSLRARLERAGSQPLTFSFDASLADFADVLYATGHVFGILALHASQWEDISLIMHSGALHILNNARAKVPLLEKLTLHVRGSSRPSGLSIDQFAIAPRLRMSTFSFLETPWRSVLVSFFPIGFYPAITNSTDLQSLSCNFPCRQSPHFSDNRRWLQNRTKGGIEYIYIHDNADRLEDDRLVWEVVGSVTTSLRSKPGEKWF